MALPEVFIDFMTPPHDMIQKFRVFGKLDPSNSDNGKKRVRQIADIRCVLHVFKIIFDLGDK